MALPEARVFFTSAGFSQRRIAERDFQARVRLQVKVGDYMCLAQAKLWRGWQPLAVNLTIGSTLSKAIPKKWRALVEYNFDLESRFD